MSGKLLYNQQSIIQGVERTLAPPLPQPQLQTSQKIYAFSLKISSMSDFFAKVHEPELIFMP